MTRRWKGPTSYVDGVAVGGVLDPHVPDGPAETAWQRRKLDYQLVNPANRRKFKIIVVGTGLAGSGAAAALGELGYEVECFTFHDAPRRAHSVAAQGGINAARNNTADNDSLQRFVIDTDGSVTDEDLEKMASTLLANTVIEEFEIIREEDAR